jgi:hypothetical protein
LFLAAYEVNLTTTHFTRLSNVIDMRVIADGGAQDALKSPQQIGDEFAVTFVKKIAKFNTDMQEVTLGNAWLRYALLRISIG